MKGLSSKLIPALGLYAITTIFSPVYANEYCDEKREQLTKEYTNNRKLFTGIASEIPSILVAGIPSVIKRSIFDKKISEYNKSSCGKVGRIQINRPFAFIPPFSLNLLRE